jgi:AmiR/NasT family two-component response regulator
MIIAADVSLQLSKLGYNVIGINIHAEDALKTIENKRPDIVLMNLKMQGSEERIRTARIIQRNFRIPVVFISGHTDRELFKQIIQAQPFAFIAKPFEMKDLKRGLNTALDRMRTEDIWKVNISHSPAEKPSSEPSGFSDLPFGKRRLPFGQLLRMKLNPTLIL